MEYSGEVPATKKIVHFLLDLSMYAYIKEHEIWLTDKDLEYLCGNLLFIL